MTESRVTMIFESADGSKRTEIGYDTDRDHVVDVEGGLHDEIVEAMMTRVRNELGRGARLVTTLVDGVEQPD